MAQELVERAPSQINASWDARRCPLRSQSASPSQSAARQVLAQRRVVLVEQDLFATHGKRLVESKTSKMHSKTKL